MAKKRFLREIFRILAVFGYLWLVLAGVRRFVGKFLLFFKTYRDILIVLTSIDS